MSEKIIRIKSGNEETTMNVTEEEYLKYYRPWWQIVTRHFVVDGKSILFSTV